MEKKLCTECGKFKIFSEFNKKKDCMYGINSICRECQKEYAKKYRENNKKYFKEYNKRYWREHKQKSSKRYEKYYKENKRCMLLKNKIYMKKLLQKYPGYINWRTAKQRCNDKNDDSYKWYGARGVRCFITLEEIGKLWYRDKAYLMKRPSIDRKDSNGHYTSDNCQFMELGDNVRKSNKERITKKEVPE